MVPPDEEGNTVETTCSMSGPGSKKEYTLKGSVAEEMRLALHSLDVESQGDSGAQTDYVRCLHRPENMERPYICYVASAIECSEGWFRCR
jgi:hypothetical protein